jgi:putative photosynthetic complex assembly protein
MATGNHETPMQTENAPSKNYKAARDGVFPRAPLYTAIALVLLSLTTVTAVRLTGSASSFASMAPAVEVRELHFTDRSDGGIDVTDARSGRVIEVIAPGTNGFLRSTLRGLARERKRQELGPEVPFRLSGRSDGRLTLEDPATGRYVDLEAFGPTNAGVFARLLLADGAPRAALQ